MNEDNAQFCQRCGRPMSATPTATLPPTMAAGTPPPSSSFPHTAAAFMKEPMFKRIPGYRDRKRTMASIFLLLAFILIAVAFATSWWGASGGGETLSISPGGTCVYQANGGTVTGCGTNSALPGVYSGVGALMGAAVALSLVAMLFAFLGAFGLNFGRWQLLLTLILPGIVFLLIISAVAYAAADTGSAAGNGVTGFWGSNTVGSTTYSYGAGAGWYIAIVSIFFLAIGALMFFRTLSQPYTARELGWTPGLAPTPMTQAIGTMWAPTAAPPPPPPPGYAAPPPAGYSAAPPPPGYVVPPPAGGPVPRICSHCAAANPPTAQFCQKCGQAL